MAKEKRVLVVDAEPRILRVAQANLQRAGYRVITASDGDEALEKAESEKPDMIVLGTMPPPMDAAELRERLRANEATKDVQVVELTGVGQDADLSETRD